jgi:hypothetical protein
MNSVNCPKGCSKELSDGKLVLVCRWWDLSHDFLMVVLAAVLDLGMVLMAWIYMDSEIPRAEMVTVWICGAISFAVVTFFTYMALARLLNRSRLTAGAGELLVRHYPLSWEKDAAVSTAAVLKLGAEEKVFRPQKGPPMVSYTLNAHMHNGKTTPLLTGMIRREQAEFLAAELNAFLSR